jgi:hypothetical protein
MSSRRESGASTWAFLFVAWMRVCATTVRAVHADCFPEVVDDAGALRTVSVPIGFMQARRDSRYRVRPRSCNRKNSAEGNYGKKNRGEIFDSRGIRLTVPNSSAIIVSRGGAAW